MSRTPSRTSTAMDRRTWVLAWAGIGRRGAVIVAEIGAAVEDQAAVVAVGAGAAGVLEAVAVEDGTVAAVAEAGTNGLSR